MITDAEAKRLSQRDAAVLIAADMGRNLTRQRARGFVRDQLDRNWITSTVPSLYEKARRPDPRWRGRVSDALIASRSTRCPP